MLDSLLERGYFPQELPPPFNTTSFADFVRRKGVAVFDVRTRKGSKLAHFNLARAGSLRRELAIPNPVHFALLADGITKHWSLLERQFHSSLSLTTPKVSPVGRAVSRMLELEDLPHKRAAIRANGRFVLMADVARFYPSIYAHSIPWAMHGKAVAKSRKNDKTLPGNEIDTLLRNCQDQQTMGIPVGPDTSLVIAELILSQVDRALAKRGIRGLRYIDDYELVCRTEEEALKARSLLQNELQSLELNLGPAKTRVARLPIPLREQWLSELRRFPLKQLRWDNQKVLLAFFDRAFDLAASNPDQGVLRYSAARLSKMRLKRSDSLLAEDLLMQCARVEAGALAYALAAMLRYPCRDKKHEKARCQFMSEIIQEHAPQRHSSEVAWALWAVLVQGFRVSKRVSNMIVDMNDPVCTLLLLHARAKGLVAETAKLQSVRNELDADSLYGPNWLLTYEAVRKGWFRFQGSRDFLRADPNFSQLRNDGVSFYDVTKTVVVRSEPPDHPFAEEQDEVDEYISRIARSYEEDDWWSDDSDDTE